MERRNQNSCRTPTNDTVTVLVETTDGTGIADTDGPDGIGMRKIGSNASNLKAFEKNGYEMNKLTVVSYSLDFSI